MLRLTIAKKLMLLVSIALLGFVVSQVYSMWVERANSSRLADVEQRIYPTLELTTINLGSLLLMEQQINSSVTTGDAQVLQETAAHYEEIRKNLAQLSSLSSDLSAQVKGIDAQLEAWYTTATRIAQSFINNTVYFVIVGVEAAAKEGRNVMEPSIACAHAGVTTGEWAGRLREDFGEYRAPTGVSGAVGFDEDF